MIPFLILLATAASIALVRILKDKPGWAWSPDEFVSVEHHAQRMAALHHVIAMEGLVPSASVYVADRSTPVAHLGTPHDLAGVVPLHDERSDCGTGQHFSRQSTTRAVPSQRRRSGPHGTSRLRSA